MPKLIRAALVAVLVAAGLVVVTGPARAAGVRGVAWLWSDLAAPELFVPYTPSPWYQYNSASPGSAVNTVTRVNTGTYRVWIPELVGFGATHATAYGDGPSYCGAGMTEAPDGALVDVVCFNGVGERADRTFSLSFTSVTTPAQPLAYMEVQPDGSIWPGRHFNSGGGISSVTRDGATYVVRIPGMGGIDGHVQVTAAIGSGVRCKVVSWSAVPDQIVRVSCWVPHALNLPDDAPFILTYTRDQSILGRAQHSSAYAWAGEPFSVEYAPFAWYRFTTAGSAATAERSGVGRYRMEFPGVDMSSGNVQVSSYGWPDQNFCTVAFWSDAIEVRCFDWSGAPADSYYTVAFTGHPVA
jgi:hypothetical protein